jgi:hypothetical protein
MARTFKTVGHSFYKEKLRLRFTNDKDARLAILERNGDKDIDLVDLPKDMTKEEAAQWIVDRKMFTPDVRNLAQALLDKNSDVDITVEESASEEDAAANPRRRTGRGRPKGAKNRPKPQSQAA